MAGFKFGRALLAAGSVGFVIKSTEVERSSILGLVRGFICEPGLISAGWTPSAAPASLLPPGEAQGILQKSLIYKCLLGQANVVINPLNLPTNLGAPTITGVFLWDLDSVLTCGVREMLHSTYGASASHLSWVFGLIGR